MNRPWRSTIRMRLSLLYATTFFLAGAVLIILTYLYLRQSLDHQVDTRVGRTEHHVEQFLADADGTARTPAQLHQTLQAQAERDRDDTLRTMLVWSLASLGVVGLTAGGVGWLLAGRALRPLQQITATARRVADRSLHERIALAGPNDEIKHLADTFDAMLERLDRSFDGQRRFVANASHELRTPLTINRALIEVALDDPHTPESTRRLGTSLLAVNQRHERLIDGLLVLAGSEEPVADNRPVDLAEIAHQVVTGSQGAAHRAGVDLRAVARPAPTVGDPILLERLAQNLLDNAIRYNIARGGWISVTAGTSGDDAYLTVENTGPVVPSDAVAGLFEPFRRLGSDDRLADADTTSPGRGAGLGLSIVRSVTHAHRGEVRAHARPGGGLVVHVRIQARGHTVAQPVRAAPRTDRPTGRLDGRDDR